MTEGECRLCRKYRALHESHLLPAGIYRIIGHTDGEAPIVVARGRSVQTSEQTAEPLLCGECEHRFNSRGESWVLANCWRSETEFRLRDMLTRVAPLARDGEYCVYAGKQVDGLDLEKLIYFGVSIFWRSAAHEWKSIIRGEERERLDLGPYEEALREYLLDIRSLPDQMIMTVIVSSRPMLGPAEISSNPYLVDRHPGYRRYGFAASGITYHLMTGKAIPEEYQRMATTRPPDFMVHATPRTLNLQDFVKTVRTAKPLGRLGKAVDAWNREWYGEPEPSQTDR